MAYKNKIDNESSGNSADAWLNRAQVMNIGESIVRLYFETSTMAILAKNHASKEIGQRFFGKEIQWEFNQPINMPECIRSQNVLFKRLNIAHRYKTGHCGCYQCGEIREQNVVTPKDWALLPYDEIYKRGLIDHVRAYCRERLSDLERAQYLKYLIHFCKFPPEFEV